MKRRFLHTVFSSWKHRCNNDNMMLDLSRKLGRGSKQIWLLPLEDTALTIDFIRKGREEEEDRIKWRKRGVIDTTNGSSLLSLSLSEYRPPFREIGSSFVGNETCKEMYGNKRQSGMKRWIEKREKGRFMSRKGELRELCRISWPEWIEREKGLITRNNEREGREEVVMTKEEKQMIGGSLSRLYILSRESEWLENTQNEETDSSVWPGYSWRMQR